MSLFRQNGYGRPILPLAALSKHGVFLLQTIYLPITFHFIYLAFVQYCESNGFPELERLNTFLFLSLILCPCSFDIAKATVSSQQFP